MLTTLREQVVLYPTKAWMRWFSFASAYLTLSMRMRAVEAGCKALVEVNVIAWYLQWIGCAFGIFGAFLLALNSPLSGWGFVSFLASNACWIVFGVLTDAPGLIFMQAAFTATSLLGIYRWMLAKPKAASVRNERLSDVIYNPREFRARKWFDRPTLAPSNRPRK